MPTCETCGNDYDKAFQVLVAGEAHTFDSFECAIHALAPTCANCGIRIVGHGLEKDGTYFCCEHCAEREGVKGLRDRVQVRSATCTDRRYGSVNSTATLPTSMQSASLRAFTDLPNPTEASR